MNQGEDARLGGRVVRLLGAADERGDGGDADYGAAGGRLRRHLGGGGLDGVEGAGEVGGQGVVEEGGGYAGRDGSVYLYAFTCVWRL